MSSQTLRTFRLEPDHSATSEAWDLVCTTNDRDEIVVRFNGKQIGRHRPALIAAVGASKHPRTILSTTRQAQIPLTEEAGVRLALTYLATAPIGKPDRADAIRHGIDAMTSEEALYWYAYATGPVGPRALRALRTLLAED
jgi:hypothetical protein